MKLPAICLAAVLLLLAGPSFSQDDPHMAKVLRVLSNTPLIDGHNDLPWAIRESVTSPHDVHAPEHNLRQPTAFHTDIPRLQEGMIGGQFWSVYVPYSPVNSGAARAQLEQIDIANQIIARYPDVFAAAYTASDVNRIFGEGRIASMLGIEGGHAIENSLGVLRAYYALGVRYMTLTHNGTLDWADAANGDQVHGGLTEFGNEVVREMNRLGMMVDLSHTSVDTMSDALDVSVAPVIWSHADTKALNDVGRNVPDEILRRLPDNGGVVMITFVGIFLTSNDEATIVDVANHIEHVVEVAGIDHVGIGSDYDGTDSLPVGMEDVSTYPKLFLELSKRGWSENDMAKLAGENILRAMSETEVVARRLQRERGPSMATIEELDGN